MKNPQRIWWLLGAFFLIYLVACTTPTPVQPTATHQTTSPTPEVDEYPMLTPAEEPTIPISTPTPPEGTLSTKTQYFLDVDLNYDQKQVKVFQTISFTNALQYTIEELPVLVPPAQKRGVFTLDSAKIDQIPVKSNLRIRNAQLQLKLDQPLESGQQIEIFLEYQLRLPKAAQPLGYTSRQLLLADWHPMIPPYQEEVGWMINPPGRVGEHLVYPLSDFHLNLCLTPSSSDLVVAASAPLAGEQDNCLVYKKQNARNISLAISPYYQVFTVENDLVTIISYTFPEHAGLGLRSAELANQAWSTFNDLFGNNQREFLSIVEADLFDGLETDGLIYLSDWYYQTADSSPQNYFELLTVHETAHQWFYAYVHNDQANEPWLDEALATYCELLYYEIHHPDLVAWWWFYRVDTYAPEGDVNANIYAFRQFRPYINAVYLRGAIFLQALRDEVGDNDFFDGLRNYVQSTDPATITSSADFFDAFSEVSDVDLSPIVTEFFQ